eukprot:5724694-Pyramimonas_sp.AAC.1
MVTGHDDACTVMTMTMWSPLSRMFLISAGSLVLSKSNPALKEALFTPLPCEPTAVSQSVSQSVRQAVRQAGAVDWPKRTPVTAAKAANK